MAAKTVPALVLCMLSCMHVLSTAQESSVASICVKNSKNATCHQQNNASTIYQLSELTFLSKNQTNDSALHTLQVYLTGGVHSLTSDLDLKITEVKIEGVLGKERSTVRCETGTGINVFGNNSQDSPKFRILIKNLAFQECGAVVNETVCHTSALYFRRVDYVLMNVTVTGSAGCGLFAFQCVEQTIQSVLFRNNEVHVRMNISNNYKDIVSIAIRKTEFCGIHLNSNVSNCKLRTEMSITDSTFIRAKIGISVTVLEGKFQILLRNSNFTGHSFAGLQIQNASAIVDNCSFDENTGTGIIEQKDKFNMLTNISNSRFNGKERALDLQPPVHISNCLFSNHSSKAVVAIKEVCLTQRKVIIENSLFTRNYRGSGDCSSLQLMSVSHAILKNLTFSDNLCTGVSIYASSVMVEGKISLINNTGLKGGALQMLSGSKLVFLQPHARLNMVSNTAKLYGGGIFSDATCADKPDCFFQFKTSPTETVLDASETLFFSGNHADMGGDVIFGGCLSNCSIEFNGKRETVNVKNSSNVFWDFVTSENSPSASKLVGYPERVVFCDVSNSQNDSTDSLCTSNKTVSAYKGLPFTIPLMVVDNSCGPSVEHITALIDQGEGRFTEDVPILHSKKDCSNFTFSVSAEQTSVTIQFVSQVKTAFLTVELLENCPIGYVYSDGICMCNDVVKKYEIECSLNGSLKVPASTWIGMVDNNSVAVQKHCQYCSTNGVNMTTDSDALCLPNRTGVLCGACIEGYSLQVGNRHKCDNCTDSTSRGILVVLADSVAAFFLIVILIALNLTVSTGLLNGLIFYSNVVYINYNIFLPLVADTESDAGTKKVVKFLSTFLAWINLEFAIDSCFFNNLTTYIKSWVLFIFPLYLWLLIFLIVLVSRHSKRVSKLTSSHTVPVLATLLLLTYTKLLSATIQTFSYTKMEFINNNSTHVVWLPDGNIRYLQGKHIPLFLMGCFMTVIYISPFTLLLLFGPLLQANSNLKFFSWINRLKPLLDAYYGPFTSRYRCWPGILLLARIILFSLFAFYSLGDKRYNLMTTSFMIVILFTLWFLIGLYSTISLYQNKYINYLELSFLVNLALFSIISLYFTDIPHKQHVLAIIMTGSVFAVFCGIVLYQFVYMLFRLKAIHKICKLISTRKQKAKSAVEDGKNQLATGSGCTHSTVQLAQSFELREPLLKE